MGFVTVRNFAKALQSSPLKSLFILVNNRELNIIKSIFNPIIMLRFKNLNLFIFIIKNIK